MKTHLSWHRLLAAAALLVSTGSYAAEFDWPEAVAWQPLYGGIDYADVPLSDPRPLRVHALRVDLGNSGVEPVTDTDNGDRPEETDGLKTSTFLTRSGCQVAINGAPFWPGVKEEGQPQNVVGLVVADGTLVSPVDDHKPRAALVFRRNPSGATLGAIESPPIETADILTAVGGYGVILQEGQVVRPSQEESGFIENLHPRTAVGVADAGRTLLMVVVDGRQPGYSEGMNLAELGQTLRWLGADAGLNLDGGGTTTMVRADSTGGFRLLNRPIDGGRPGTERVSASHLGIRRRTIQP